MVLTSIVTSKTDLFRSFGSNWMVPFSPLKLPATLNPKFVILNFTEEFSSSGVKDCAFEKKDSAKQMLTSKQCFIEQIRFLCLITIPHSVKVLLRGLAFSNKGFAFLFSLKTQRQDL